MSKRYFPQQYGDRKKPKLDISRSDHNFPLSQNISDANSKASDQADTWGDDNDDEILLLASQACEEAYNNDISSIPDYSICMKPGTTSTQLCEPGTSTSNFFKKPSAIPNNVLTTELKDKCNRISSPLPGMSSKIINPKNEVNLTDDLIFKQDSDHIYRQLLQLQEENNKLKSDNGKLLEKCVTKEGESSILRTQLKSCQIAVDNARMEKIKAQEKVQQEWTEKLQAANSQMHDLRTQLDFKNLEIISVKEKVRMLESSKIKLTQVMVGHNDISSSQQQGRNSSVMNDSTLVPKKHVRVPTNNCIVQTDCARMLQLNKTMASDQNYLTSYLPIILEKTEDVFRITLNEKLQPHSEIQTTKCKVYSTFHRIPSSPVLKERKCEISLETVHKSLTEISTRGVCERSLLEILKTARLSLEQVQIELEEVSRKMTNAFQKEMDEKYIEASLEYIDISDKDLISGRALFPEEQAILSRRIVAIPHMLEVQSDILNLFHSTDVRLMDVVHKICALLDNTSCAHMYSGLLLSITNIIHMTVKGPYKSCNKDIQTERTTKDAAKIQNGTIQTQNQNMTRTMKDNLDKDIQIIKDIITSRPLSFVTCRLLVLLRELFAAGCSVDRFCPGGAGANLRLDYDQGVLLYKKESCLLQVFLKQVEATLRCIEKQSLCSKALEVTQNLILFNANVNGIQNADRENRCDCQLVLMQVIVYALRICAVMMKDKKTTTKSSLLDNTKTAANSSLLDNTKTATKSSFLDNTKTVTKSSMLENTKTATKSSLLAVCRAGIQPLYHCLFRDIEFSSQLGHNEGHLCQFTEIMRANVDGHSEGILNMLSELSSAFQSSPEDTTSSYSRQPWINSFESFCITD